VKQIALIGYSGHAFVLADIAFLCGYNIIGYLEKQEKDYNPFSLKYLGSETALNSKYFNIENTSFIIGIGNYHIRRVITNSLQHINIPYSILQHPHAIIASSAIIKEGSVVMASVSINPLAKVGRHVICNTGCIIDHECIIGDYVHIAPGAVLTGNVEVGECTLIGANTVINPGIKIGSNAVIGAGSVVLSNIPDNAVAYGNPAKIK
jgi:sugar O-acyltransferase (sialic acid O-acetyltransferase NeuD family)